MANKKEQMKDITRKERLATVGLFVVLLILKICLIGAIFIIWQTTSQAGEAVAMSHLYLQTRYRILSQNIPLLEYITRPDSENKRAFLDNFQHTQALLHKIESVGGVSDIAAVQPILVEQGRYFTLAQHLFILADAHSIIQASAFEDSTMDPLFNTISNQINRDATLDHNVSLQSITQTEAVLHLILIAALLVPLFGMFLILLFLRTIRHYQHRQYALALTEQDMLRMANVQLHLLPQELPAVGGLEMYAHSRPARDVGGDFYTFDRHTSGQYVLTIGDVSGKGLRAALLMAMVRTIVHVTVHALLQLEPKAIGSKVNEHLYDDFTEVGMFATIFMSCYDPTTRHLTYTNAGHSPVVYCPAGGPARLLGADVPMIGVLPILPTKDSGISLGPGDILVMATDGLSEAQDTSGEMFGYKRLLALIEALQHESARHIAETLFETVNHFALGCEQFDDQTLVIMKGISQ